MKIMINLLRLVTFLCSFLFVESTYAVGGSGVTLRPSSLKASPVPDAAITMEFKQGAKVTVLDRKGFWYQIDSGGQKGWLKVTEVKLDSGESATAGLAAFATGRGSTGNVVSASGSRGLSAEELTTAKPDEAALAQVDAMKVSVDAALAFAKAGKLSSRQLAYLASPAKQSDKNPKKKK
jgi:hypothetical protein